MAQFRARFASSRTTPSRADDARTVTRLQFEAHDISVDELHEMLSETVMLQVMLAPPAMTPMEEAIEVSKNGSAAATVVVPDAGRRRRGTRAE